MLISVLNIKLTCEWHKAIKLNYKDTRTHVIVVLRVTKHFTCAVAARNALEPAVDKDGQCAAYGYYVTRTRYSTWNRKKTTLFSGLYLRNLSTLDILTQGTLSRSFVRSSWDTLYISWNFKKNSYFCRNKKCVLYLFYQNKRKMTNKTST